MWCMQRQRARRLFPEKAAPPGGDSEAPAFAKSGRTLDSQAARLGRGILVDRDAAPSGQLRPPAPGPKPASERLAGAVSAPRLPACPPHLSHMG